MRKWIMLMVAAVILTGCEPQATPQNVRALAKDTQQAITTVEDAQGTVNVLKDYLATLDVIDPELEAKINKVQEEIDRVQPQVNTIGKAIATADYSNDEGWVTLLEAARAGNIASAAFNPYAVIIETVLGGIITLLGIFKRKERKAKESVGRKYQAHKEGVETFSRKHPTKSAELYDNIGLKRATLGVK